jgi:hypothetical protein
MICNTGDTGLFCHYVQHAPPPSLVVLGFLHQIGHDVSFP